MTEQETSISLTLRVPGLIDGDPGDVEAAVLEDLPLLSQAAHQGSIEWSKLREVVPVATAETERFWLEACATMTYAQIERLASLTPCGEFPRLPEAADTRPEEKEESPAAC